MSDNTVYQPDENKKRFSQIYSGVFFLSIMVLITVIFTSIRTNVVTNSVLSKKNLAFLLIVSDDNGPLLTGVVLYNAQTKRLALVDIPYQAGDLLPMLKRSDRYSIFYQQGDLAQYQSSIETLLDLELLFFLDLHVEQLVHLVDLLEGFHLYFFAPINRINPLNEARYIYHAGKQYLDGERAKHVLYANINTQNYPEYLKQKNQPKQQNQNQKTEEPAPVSPLSQSPVPSSQINPLDESDSIIPEDNISKDNLLRQKNLRYLRELLFSIINTLQKYSLQRDDYIKLMYGYFQTNLNWRSFRELLLYINEIDLQAPEVILQNYLGKDRIVQGKEISFPVYNGQVMRSQIVRISRQLYTLEQIATQEQYPVRVEVLNGTYINGLASRTGALYSQNGFDVIHIDNADRSDYEKTVIINLHSNNLEDIRRVAKLIEATNVILQPLPGGEQAEAEIRIILGRDFDGRRVKK